MMRKKRLLLLPLLTTSIMATSAIAHVSLANETNISQESISKQAATTAATTNTSGLVNLSDSSNSTNGQVSIPSSYYAQNDIESISNDNGPILLFDEGKAFGATDWYGNPAWYISLGSSDGYYSGSWFSTSTTSPIDFSKAGNKVVDWAYNHKTDNLYVLTDNSYLIIIQSKTGQIVSANPVFNSSTNTKDSNKTVNKIQIIDFNSSVYLWDSTKKNPEIYQVDPKTGSLQNEGNDIKDSSSYLKNKYLFALIPLDVNYSIAVTSDSEVKEENNSSNLTLSLDLVTDNMKKLITNSSTSRTAPQNSQSVSISNSVNGKDIYTSAFKRNSDYVVFIYNKIYTLSLNKSSINDSNFSEIQKSTIDKAAETSASKCVNSAYIDASNQVYYKLDGATTATYISVSNSFTDISLLSTSNGVFTNSNQSDLQGAQIFAVPTSSDDLVSQSYTGYVLSPNNFIGTGIKNNSILSYKFTDNSRNPQFTIQNINSVIPSSVGKSAITKGNSISNLVLDNNNAILIADDIAGVLYVKVPYIINQPWYSDNSTVKSSGYLIGKMKCQSAKNGTTWVADNTFSGLFGKLEPNQINETMLNAKGQQILNIPQSILGLQNNQLSINFIINSRENQKGTLKISATVSYVNAYGLKVSYKMEEHEYTVKTGATNYAFSFAGVSSDQISQINKTQTTTDKLKSEAKSAISNDSDTNFLTIDISTITSMADIYKNYANTLPSFWQVDGVKDFIVRSDRYPSDPVITVLASDDSKGTIIILVTYNNLSNNTASRFAIKYKGITTLEGSKVKFQGSNATSPTKPNGQLAFTDAPIKDITKVAGFNDYNTKLSSDVKSNALSALYSSPLITNMGFAPVVSIVDSKSQTARDGTSPEENETTDKNSSLDMEYGSILLKIDFSKSQSSNLINSNGKKITIPQEYYSKLGLDNNGCVYQRYIGMLPIGSTYGITLDQNGTQCKSLIKNNNVNSSFSQDNLLGILNIRGYQNGEVTVTNFAWNGENLIFTVHGQSKTYDTVNTNQTFVVSWAPKFASARNTSLAIAILTSLVGILLVALGVALYVIRRNKIRKLLK